MVVCLFPFSLLETQGLIVQTSVELTVDQAACPQLRFPSGNLRLYPVDNGS